MFEIDKSANILNYLPDYIVEYKVESVLKILRAIEKSDKNIRDLLNFPNKKGRKPLQLAFDNDQFDFFEILLELANRNNVENLIDRQFLEEAMSKKCIPIVSLILSQKSDSANSIPKRDLEAIIKQRKITFSSFQPFISGPTNPFHTFGDSQHHEAETKQISSFRPFISSPTNPFHTFGDSHTMKRRPNKFLVMLMNYLRIHGQDQTQTRTKKWKITEI